MKESVNYSRFWNENWENSCLENHKTFIAEEKIRMVEHIFGRVKVKLWASASKIIK